MTNESINKPKQNNRLLPKHMFIVAIKCLEQDHVDFYNFTENAECLEFVEYALKNFSQIEEFALELYVKSASE